MTLRGMAATARAVDEDAFHIFGFSLTDAIEVILAHSHRSMTTLVASCAAACGVDGDGAWRVVPLMVTRRVEPAAYATAPQVAFALAHQLAATLTDACDPEPGSRA